MKMGIITYAKYFYDYFRANYGSYFISPSFSSKPEADEGVADKMVSYQ